MADKGGDSAEKKHKPTRWRLRMARERGDVARSKDLTSAVVLTAWIAAGALGTPALVRAWEHQADAIAAAVARPTVDVMLQHLWDCSTLAFVTVLALSVPVGVIGLLAQFAQVGPIFTMSKVSLDFSHLNPMAWLERLTKWETGVELLKSLAKQIMVVAIGYAVFKSRLLLVLGLPTETPGALLPMLARVLLPLFGVAAALGLGLGYLDLLFQRFTFLKKMRLSTAEFRRDWKLMDGDPKIKSKRKQLYREWANHNAAEATRGAVVVITNPTHYAVALAYDPTEHAAPVLAAKGQDDLAAEIRRAAEDAAVPIIRNPPLARELHERLDIDETVPEDLFVVVAEVILWASRLRQVTGEDEPVSP